jgi:glycerol-3-phosphate acyltransferase PlsY
VLVALLLILAGYLIGAIPFGYLVARGLGVNILRQGSLNIGATNVGRVLGRNPAPGQPPAPLARQRKSTEGECRDAQPE